MSDDRTDFPTARDAAIHVVRTLRDAGHVAYFAGGCVRDMLLAIEPKDYDVATDAPPPRVRELFKRTQAVGQAFGVILVRLGSHMIEVATFRTDADYADGRRPTAVTFTTAEHDAERRDFTINGLFFDPIDAKVIDFVNGQHDLDQRILRAIGDPSKRFAEDYLRMLRAVRFAARFGFTVDPATADAIRANAGKLTKISAERIADELRRMLTPPTRELAYRLLWDLSLVDAIFAPLGSRAAPLHGDRSLFVHLSSAESASFGAALLAALIDYRWQASGMKHDLLGNLAPSDAKKVIDFARRHLKLSNDELEEMADIAKWTHAVLVTPTPGVALVRRFLARPYAGAARAMLAALRKIGLATDRIDALQRTIEHYQSVDNAPPPLVTGDDLVALGYAPGPAFKRALDQVYDAQLESRVVDQASAIALAKTFIEGPRM